MANFEKGTSKEYTLKDPKNGLYVFNLKGDIEVDSQKMESRDGFGLWNRKSVQITADSDAEFLLMEVPMELN